MIDVVQPEMILPPGWVWIDLRRDLNEQVHDMFADAWQAGPKDSIGPHVRQLEDAVLAVLREALDSGGMIVVMPIGTPWQVPLSVAITLAHITPDSGAVALPPASERATFIPSEAGDALLQVRDEPVEFVAASDEDPPLTTLRTLEATWVTPDHRAYLLATATITGAPVHEFKPVMEALGELIVTMFTSLAWASESSNVS